MVFENEVKNIQAAAYNGARTVYQKATLKRRIEEILRYCPDGQICPETKGYKINWSFYSTWKL